MGIARERKQIHYSGLRIGIFAKLAVHQATVVEVRADADQEYKAKPRDLIGWNMIDQGYLAAQQGPEGRLAGREPHLANAPDPSRVRAGRRR